MKPILTLLAILILSMPCMAQSGINYKAIMKDGSGNILSSQSVDVQFILYEGAALTNNVYQESHTTNTDANGIIVVNVGEGTTADVFADVVWGNDEHWLNVQVDTGAGLVDLGTTQFMAVPYAKHSEVANSAENVKGLEALDEGNGIGHRIIGRDLNNLGNIGLNAVDLSGSPIASTTFGATGEYSVAMNRQTTAQGLFSTAMGLDSKAYGNTSVAMGFNTITNGFDAVAMGAFTIADATQSLAIGRYNVAGGNTSTWIDTDAIFEIGIGVDDANRSNAFTVFKDGGITAPNLTIAEIDNYGNSSLMTKQYTDDAYAPKVVTTTVVIPHVEFVPSSPGNDLYLLQGVAYFTQGNAELIAPVEIPEGSTITSITAIIKDSGSDNFDFSLVYQYLFSSTENTIFTLTTNISSGAQDLTYSTPIFIYVGAQYYIIIKPTSGSSWPFPFTSGVKGVRISYTN